MRSSASPPKTIAPSRPLPTGRASTHWVAGRRYQRLNGSSGAVAELVKRFVSGATLREASTAGTRASAVAMEKRVFIKATSEARESAHERVAKLFRRHAGGLFEGDAKTIGALVAA